MTPPNDLDTLLRDGMRPDPEHVAKLMGNGTVVRPDPDNPSRIIYYRYGRIVGVAKKEPAKP